MSSLALFNAIPSGAIEVLYDSTNQPCFKRADLGKYLEIKDNRHNFNNFERYFITRSELIEGGGDTPTIGKLKNLHDVFVTLEGAIETTVRSNKPKAVKLVKWLVNKGIAKLEEEYKQALDNLQAIRYENVGLQGEIRAKDQHIVDLVHNRHVPRSGDYDNVLVAFQKNKPIEDNIKKLRHPFYMMRCQKRKQSKLTARLKKEYPDMIEKGVCEDPNALHRWCWFKEDVLGEEKYFKNHFTLDTDIQEEFEDLFQIFM